MITSEEIKEYSLSLGYCSVGITSADGFPDYIREVQSRGDYFDFFDYTTANPLKGAMPKYYMSEARSIIVLVWDYYQKEYPENLKKMIGKAYLSRSYGPQENSIHKARLLLMQRFLEEQGCRCREAPGIPARWAGMMAGAVDIGRNNFAYARDAGSYNIIYTLLVDQELEYDKPYAECQCPPNCHICMDVCPTKALEAPFRLNPKRCIGFNNWTRQDGRGKITGTVPIELREMIGCHIHGCDICQDTCPRNREKLGETREPDRFVELLGKDLDLRAILHMDEDFYQRRVHPILYNYIKDVRYLRRNAIIAMGNSGDLSYLDDLAQASSCEDPMIAECARWAVEKVRCE